MYVDVALPLGIHQTFTYRVSADLGTRPHVGARVVVPFGNKPLTGYIVGVQESLDPTLEDVRVREILQLVDSEPIVSQNILDLTRWVSQFYLSSWGEAIRAALPAGLGVASEIHFTITSAGAQALAKMGRARMETSSRTRALEMLSRQGSVSFNEWQQQFGKARAQAISRELERKGHIDRHFHVGDPHVKPKVQNVVRIRTGPLDSVTLQKVTVKQRRVLETLSAAGDALPIGQLADQSGVGPSVIRTLERRGVVEVFPREIRRDPLRHIDITPPDPITLTEAQQSALDIIKNELVAGSYATVLLHGVTGSGKTEIYFRAMSTALSLGKTAVMLVPEIALTPVFSRRLRGQFGEDVAILHSSLSDGERFDEWNRIRRGEAHVVIGTRSAVFAPVRQLGIIVVDEEQETSYKQDDSPRYHGRDTAIMRAHAEGAVALLGSATPSLETYHNSRLGKYLYLQLKERIGGRPMADVQIVDMRHVFAQHGKQVVFSDELIIALQETFARGEQSIILLNRRGFAPLVMCRRCGLMQRCAQCDVTLTYHKEVEKLICHYCKYQVVPGTTCDACGGEYIFYAGVGTEQVQARLQQMFPKMAIARMDRDTMRHRGSHDRLIMEFASGKVHTLVGTQMIAKGHDFPNVTLVGVISVDASLGLPDFRAAERTFQLLTQVAGRAGRGNVPGRVIIQSYYPEHYALRFAQRQDSDGFYRTEVHYRQSFHYPPFTTLALVLVRHRSQKKVDAIADAFARQLMATAPKPPLMRILGPAPAPLSRLRGEHRRHIIIKCRQRSLARKSIQSALRWTREAGIDSHAISVDIDPVDLM